VPIAPEPTAVLFVQVVHEPNVKSPKPVSFVPVETLVIELRPKAVFVGSDGGICPNLIPFIVDGNPTIVAANAVFPVSK